MPILRETVRVTIPDAALWRNCTVCGVLAALPPEVDTCEVCQAAVEERDR